MTKSIQSFYKSEHASWISAKRRCHSRTDPSFHYYGEKGIQMSEEWRNDFAQFVFDMGPKPSSKHTLDRIDNNKGYYQSNCKWSTRKEQNRNKKNTIQVTIDGITKPLGKWCEEYNIPYGKASLRLKYGWSPKDALTTVL